MSMKTKNQIAVSLPEEGDAYWTGFLNVIKLSGEDTGGAFSVVEEHLAPGDGAPPHIHHNEDQTDYVARGEVEFMVGGRTVRATAGAIVHGPKGVPHAFKNVGDGKAVIYSWFHPAGFEECIARVGDPAEDPTDPPPEPDMEKLMALAPEYGLEMLAPEGEDGAG